MESSMESIRFDYVQEMRSELTSEIKQSSGTAYFKKPKQLRVEQQTPEPQLIVSEGKTIFIYTPRFGQVLKDSWTKWSSQNLLFPGLVTFSNTFQNLKKNYSWEILESVEINGEKNLVVKLIPTTKTQEKSWLKLWLREQDYLPRKTEWVSGTLSLVTTMGSLEKNAELKPDLFKFNRPPNTEVIQAP